MKVKKSDIGRFVRIEYEDIGAVDGVIVDVKGDRVHYLSLADRTLTDNNGAPVIALGKQVDARNSGL
jgi:hypothetical protein